MDHRAVGHREREVESAGLESHPFDSLRSLRAGSGAKDALGWSTRLILKSH